MANKVGPLIKDARTAAGMTQEQLAKKIPGVAAADISKFERGEVVPTQAVLKEIAKLTGVTQSSLINAAKESTPAKAAAKSTAKTAAAKSTTKSAAKNTTTKSTATKPAATKSAATKKTATPASANTSMKVTATEKKLIELYRAANSDTKKAATRVLRGECNDMITSLLGGDMVSDLISGVVGSILGGGK